MKHRISISVIMSVLILIVSIAASTAINKSTSDKITSLITTATSDEVYADNEEMRGLWVSYLTLDMNDSEKSFEGFKNKFDTIINDAKSMKCNTLIVQVRPFCDALYDSEYFPYSHILTGNQGIDPGYDALEYICDSAHANGLKIHAWVNPLRIKNTTSGFELSNNNPYVKNPDIAVEVDSGIYLNPALKTARQLIVDGVVEIIQNYSVDGIQFDDYFYPVDIVNEDAENYNTYKKTVASAENVLTLQKWRENNINILIAEVYRAIKETDSSVQFGISPQGNIENNYNICADTTLWCETIGYVDYICPQLYYSLDNPTLRFEEALKIWNNISYHEKIKVYIGLAAYKAGTAEDEGTWLESNTILSEELALIRRYGYDGYMIYDYNALKSDEAKSELNNLIDNV